MNKRYEDYMCCIFAEESAAAAKEKWSSHEIRNYGSRCGDYCLHTWDHGERYLAQCNYCGKLLLIQNSEYNDFVRDEDDYYTDIFPVKSAEEAEMLNQNYDGFAIETELERMALFMTNGKPFWH